MADSDPVKQYTYTLTQTNVAYPGKDAFIAGVNGKFFAVIYLPETKTIVIESDHAANDPVVTNYLTTQMAIATNPVVTGDPGIIQSTFNTVVNFFGNLFN